MRVTKLFQLLFLTYTALLQGARFSIRGMLCQGDFMKAIFLIALVLMSGLAKADPIFEATANEYQSLAEVENNFRLASEELIAQQDPRGAFVKVYEVITRNIEQMLAQNYFEDPVWVRQVGLAYANYFRRSFFSYQIYQTSGAWTSAVPSSWWLAFSENKQNNLAVPVQLILSVNAHIQNDLPNALIESGADFSERCHRDYIRIGDVFAKSFAESWQAVYRIDHRQRSDVEQVIGTWMAQNWIEIFRDGAWENGKKLVNGEITAQQIDEKSYKAGIGFRTLDFWTK